MNVKPIAVAIVVAACFVAATLKVDKAFILALGYFSVLVIDEM